jgi:hypothetical protein
MLSHQSVYVYAQRSDPSHLTCGLLEAAENYRERPKPLRLRTLKFGGVGPGGPPTASRLHTSMVHPHGDRNHEEAD